VLSSFSVPERSHQPFAVSLVFADLTSFTLPQSHPRPRLVRCVEQVIFPNTGWSILQMALNIWEDGAEEVEPFFDTSFSLLSVLHWAFPGESPKANLRVNFKHLADAAIYNSRSGLGR
jgi:hypothetical protein